MIIKGSYALFNSGGNTEFGNSGWAAESTERTDSYQLFDHSRQLFELRTQMYSLLSEFASDI